MGYTKEQIRTIEIVRKYIKPGDLLTSELDGGMIAEHTFSKFNSGDDYLQCLPTSETLKHLNPNIYRDSLNLVHAVNVTHINRQSVESIPYLAKNSL